MSHNKKYNLGLIRESLAQHVVALMLENKDPSPIFSLVENFLSFGPIKEELKLFDAVFSLRGKNDSVVQRVLDEVRLYSYKIDQEKLFKAKAILVKEINERISPKIFDYKIKDYRLYASIQQFINEFTKKKSITSSVENIENRQSICEMLKDNLKEERDCSKTKLDSFVYLSAVDNITSKLKELKSEQRNLVLEYLDTVSSNRDTKAFFEKNIRGKMLLFESYNSTSEDTNKKLTVAKKQFESLLSDCSICEEHKLKKLLEFENLFTELKS